MKVSFQMHGMSVEGEPGSLLSHIDESWIVCNLDAVHLVRGGLILKLGYDDRSCSGVHVHHRAGAQEAPPHAEEQYVYSPLIRLSGLTKIPAMDACRATQSWMAKLLQVEYCLNRATSKFPRRHFMKSGGGNLHDHQSPTCSRQLRLIVIVHNSGTDSSQGKYLNV